MKHLTKLASLVFLIFCTSCDESKDKQIKQLQSDLEYYRAENEKMKADNSEAQQPEEVVARESYSSNLSSQPNSIRNRTEGEDLLLELSRPSVILDALDSKRWPIYVFGEIIYERPKQIYVPRRVVEEGGFRADGSYQQERSEPERWETAYDTYVYLTDVIQYDNSFVTDNAYAFIDEWERKLRSSLNEEQKASTIISRHVYRYYSYTNASKALEKKRRTPFL